jgi:hypothetical protein
VASGRAAGRGGGGIIRLRAAGVLSACLLAGAGSCGIDTFGGYLPKPEVKSAGGQEYIIDHRAGAYESNFLGYEVYYRIYDKKDKALADASTIINGWNESNPSSVQQLISTTLKYRRMTLAHDMSGVLVEALDIPADIEIRLDFSLVQADGELLLYLGNNEGVPVYRGIAEANQDTGKSFSIISAGDEDAELASESGPGTALYIQAYAFAQGIDDSFVYFYSQAAALGLLEGALVLE